MISGRSIEITTSPSQSSKPANSLRRSGCKCTVSDHLSVPRETFWLRSRRIPSATNRSLLKAYPSQPRGGGDQRQFWRRPQLTWGWVGCGCRMGLSLGLPEAHRSRRRGSQQANCFGYACPCSGGSETTASHRLFCSCRCPSRASLLQNFQIHNSKLASRCFRPMVLQTAETTVLGTRAAGISLQPVGSGPTTGGRNYLNPPVANLKL